ncbi:MAG: GTPase domain-containing protein [Deltaproteobacteria bacterium]|nr:GTPase domain-containing protein [Deltaproteobacteria bacterium]
MVLFNYAVKEITAKVVFYGPGLCGKTTNLQYIHSKMNPNTRGKLLSLATETDRTLFFDFLPVQLGKIRGFNVRFQLYTVPGQVYYNATRRLVLKGADAVVFVADSQKEMADKNVESLENLSENLLANGLDPQTIPLVIQYNKRDLANVMEVEELDHMLNNRNVPTHTAVALTGEGVLETFKLVTRELMQSLRSKHDVDGTAAEQQPVPMETVQRDVDQAAPDPSGTGAVSPVGWDEKNPGAGGRAAPPAGDDSLTASVLQIENRIQKMEAQLDRLLSRDETVENLLLEIREKLGGVFAEHAPSVEIEEPILLEEKRRKKGFFWNR